MLADESRAADFADSGNEDFNRTIRSGNLSAEDYAKENQLPDV